LREIGKPKQLIWKASMSPDGKLLACAGSVLEVATGKELLHLEGGSLNVTFSPDGKFLAWTNRAKGEEADLRILDVISKREIRHFRDCLKDPLRVQFTPRGDLLAAVVFDYSKVTLLDVATGKQRYLLDHGPTAGLLDAIAISADGRFLASGARDESLRIWDLMTGKLQRRLPVPGSTPLALAFSPDGKTLACGTWNHTIHLWDTATWKKRPQAEGHHGLVSFVDFTPDGKRLLTGSYDQTARLWDLAHGKELVRFKPFPKTPFPVAALSPDGDVLATNGEGGISARAQLWDVGRGKLVRVVGPKRTEPNELSHLAFLPDGQRLAMFDNKISIWDVVRDRKAEPFQEAENEGLWMSSVNTPSRSAVSISRYDGSVVVWNLNSGREVRRFAGQRRADALAVSPDGRVLALWGSSQSNDPMVHVLELATGKERLRLEKGDVNWYENTQPIAFSPDGRFLAAAAEKRKARLWDVATGKLLVDLQGHDGEVQSLAFSRDGKLLATASLDTTALVWDVSRWTKELTAKPLPVKAEELDRLIKDLASADAAKAYRTMKPLEDSGAAAVATLSRALLEPSPFADERTEKRTAGFIEKLNHPKFAERERSTRELEQLADLAEPALLAVLEKPPTEEVRQRVARLLQRLDPRDLSPKRVFQVRALEVLGHIGTTEARRVVERLARGHARAWLSQEAAKTLEYVQGHR
jgi:WD40 repeat protein